ncbi:hypothetical protein ANAPC1_01270 [Anaplasma phagocytophilum]|uniref:Uncharacterized protein n=1 Tax=Anaplasma phagocytophilum TaxID=948 RepID=A0AA45ZI28_ANAPH|nr:hypothetical protein ANAPC1_01270 [Anaplasma phagocytophilum]
MILVRRVVLRILLLLTSPWLMSVGNLVLGSLFKLAYLKRGAKGIFGSCAVF